jgi:hypothetical protein
VRHISLGFVVVSLAAGAACGASDSPSEAELIDQRAAEVMPFDLDKTTHTFDKLPTGGEQTVAALDPDDAEQVALIREHLLAEAEAFRRGDYSDPAEIHGMDMPGLDQLRAGHREIRVDYTELDDGAQLVYTTTDDTLVEALHAWFDRQTMDHG